jgi:hypothetical protein
VKRVYATTNPTEAELVRARLRDAGIESLLDNEGGAAYAIGLPTSVSPLGIDVADEDAAEAERILSSPASEGEPDPEAPPPLSTEESAAFEEKVRRGNRRWGRWLVYVYFLPGAVMLLVCIFRGELTGAVSVAAAMAAVLAVGWFVNLLLESQVKE